MTSAAAGPPVAAEQAGWLALGAEEASFTQALVDHMWPADELTPSGSDLGIATYIDRQLAGSFGQGDRLYQQGPYRKGKPQHGWQVPMTPARYYAAGLAAADDACRIRHAGRSFDRLEAAQREAFLTDLAAGRLRMGRVDLAHWFNALVYPLFVEGAFADPIYGGNKGKAAWRMIGYAGLPAVYTPEEIREHRGKRHPNAANPRSIQDFS